MDPVFERAIEITLEHEGGFVNHPEDPGGATNWGVSLRYLRKRGDLDGDGLPDGDLDGDGDVDVDDIRNMSREQAIEIYRTGWWERYRYGELAAPVAVKAFDLSVNMGSRQAHKLLQRGCHAAENPTPDDGKIGPNTIAAARACDDEMLLAALRSEAAGFYRMLTERNRALRKRGHDVPNFAVFLRGWLNRAYT